MTVTRESAMSVTSGVTCPSANGRTRAQEANVSGLKLHEQSPETDAPASAIQSPATPDGAGAEFTGLVMRSSPFANSQLVEAIKRAEEDEADAREEEEDELRQEAMATPPQRMVSWQDEAGRELVSVREFEPSESGAEVIDTSWEPERKTCCCIM